jgi:hypothetical protein
MYTVCTQNLILVFQLPFLGPIPAFFVWIALAASGLTFAGLLHHFVKLPSEITLPAHLTSGEKSAGVSQPNRSGLE